MNLSLDPQENDTSTVLDLIRFLAAFAVLFGHGISFFGVARQLQAPSSPYMQNVGVLVFFVLSGFLIALVLHRSRTTGGSLGAYLIDRFARIYSGLVPSMLVIGAMDWWMVSQSVHSHPHYVSVGYWFGNLAMLNGYRDIFSPILSMPNFGSAGQLWTLAVEVHLYVFVGAVFFLCGRFFSMGPLILAALFSVVPITYFSFAREPGAGIAWLWMLGFAAFYLTNGWTRRLSRPGLMLGIVVLTLAAFQVAVPGREYDGAIYPLLAGAFVLAILLTQQTRFFRERPRARTFIRYCADFSFTLYLVHHTVVYLAHRLMPDSGWAGVGLSVSASLALSILMAHLGEKHHKALARKLKAMLLTRPAMGQAVASK